MYYFEKMSSASGCFASRPPLELCSWTPLEDFCPSDPLIAHPWKKNPAGDHGFKTAKCQSNRLIKEGLGLHVGLNEMK